MELLLGIGVGDVFTRIPYSTLTHVILPSTLASMMFRYCPAKAKLHLGANVSKLRAFWSEFLNRPRTAAWAPAHPWLAGQSVADLATTVPCSLHVDAGPITKRKSATIISWTSMLAEGNEKGCQYLIGSYIQTNNTGGYPAGRRIIEEFDAMATWADRQHSHRP